MSYAIPESALNSPALEPPNGVIPNFERPSSGNSYAQASLGICICLSTIVVSVRIYTRFFLLKISHLGDYALIAAWAMYTFYIGLCLRLVESHGVLVHQWDLKMRDFIEFGRLNILMGNAVVVFFPLIKAAISLEWVHLFSPSRTNKLAFWSSWTVLWFNVIFYAISIILLNIACVPHERIWNPLIPGTCKKIHDPVHLLIVAVVNLVTDIALLVIPQKVIWGLHLSRKRRLGISAVFTTGLVACAIAFFRLVFSWRRIGAQDFTYTTSAIIICGIVEGLCGILVMCLPTLPKFFGAICKSRPSSSINSWPLVNYFRRRKQSSQSSWSNTLELGHMGTRRVRLPANTLSDQDNDSLDDSSRSETAILDTK